MFKSQFGKRLTANHSLPSYLEEVVNGLSVFCLMKQAEDEELYLFRVILIGGNVMTTCGFSKNNGFAIFEFNLVCPTIHQQILF